jgi:hypothetical protein
VFEDQFINEWFMELVFYKLITSIFVSHKLVLAEVE